MTRMSRSLACAAAVLLFGIGGPVQAAIVFRIIPAVGPVDSSPSFSGPGNWAANAVTSMRNSSPTGLPLTVGGDPNTTPSAFQPHPQSVQFREMLTASGFNSWLGFAGPTGAFAGEFGNGVLFVVEARATAGETFSLNDLRADLTIGAVSLLNNDFNSLYPAYNTVNPIGFLGGVPVVGANTGLVDQLIFAGIRLSDDVQPFFDGSSAPPPGFPPPSPVGNAQRSLDAGVFELNLLKNNPNDPFEGLPLSVTYRFATNPAILQGNTLAIILAIPEPGSLGLWMVVAGAGGAAGFFRRRSAGKRLSCGTPAV